MWKQLGQGAASHSTIYLLHDGTLCKYYKILQVYKYQIFSLLRVFSGMTAYNSGYTSITQEMTPTLASCANPRGLAPRASTTRRSACQQDRQSRLGFFETDSWWCTGLTSIWWQLSFHRTLKAHREEFKIKYDKMDCIYQSSFPECRFIRAVWLQLRCPQIHTNSNTFPMHAPYTLRKTTLMEHWQTKLTQAHPLRGLWVNIDMKQGQPAPWLWNYVRLCWTIWIPYCTIL